MGFEGVRYKDASPGGPHVDAAQHLIRTQAEAPELPVTKLPPITKLL